MLTGKICVMIFITKIVSPFGAKKLLVSLANQYFLVPRESTEKQKILQVKV